MKLCHPFGTLDISTGSDNNFPLLPLGSAIFNFQDIFLFIYKNFLKKLYPVKSPFANILYSLV